MKFVRFTYALLMVLLLAEVLSACKSNNKLNRGIAGLTTRYNIYFNGNDQYKQQLKVMEEQTSSDDFSVGLKLHPVYALVGKKQPGTAFDVAIDKCKKCVQTKSITVKPKRKAKNTPEYKLWLSRDEYNPYMHHAWLLTGKCQFYNGDFGSAQATYNYTARHFWWKPLAVAESHIMSARTQSVQGYRFDAESELDLAIPQKQFHNLDELKKHPVFSQWPKRLQREFALTQATILLCDTANQQAAIPYLKYARRGWNSKAQQIRSDFFVAQLLEENGRYSEAERQYGKIVHSARDYKTQFNARIAQVRAKGLSVSSGKANVSSLAKVERKLNQLRRQARNEDYLDQLYTALGDVSLMRHDTLKALERYELAVEKSKRGGMDKAMAALRLGQLAFQKADYVKAQKGYSTVMSIINAEYKDYAAIQTLSAVLDELQTHAETVQLQGSLLHLSTLSEAELNKVIDNLIKELKRREKEEADAAALAAYEDRKNQEADPLAQNNTLPTVGAADKSWYFYNPSTVSQGKSEFQRKWGSRKPQDDWRRKNKTEVMDLASNENNDESDGENPSDGEGENPTENENTAVADTTTIDQSKAADPHNREYYLVQIPRTPEEIDNAHHLIEEGLYNEGVIINEKLENFPLAIKTFQEMERRYPESVYRLETYYAIYLMYMRTNRPAEAEEWRQKLLAAFPESAYGIAVSDPNYIQNLKAMAQGQDSLYISTYNQYLHSASDSVHQAYYYVHDNWPLSKLMPKFIFLHALSYVQEGNQQAFQETLEQLTATYPDSDVSPLASLMIKGLHEGRTTQKGAVTRGMMWGASLRQATDSTNIDSTAIFVDNDFVPHLLLLAYKTDSVSANDLLFEIAKFNFENYLVRDFDLETIDTGGGISVLVISSFRDLNDLIRYHDRMEASTTLQLPEGIYMIDISDINFRALLGGRTFDEYFEWVEQTYGNPADPEAQE